MITFQIERRAVYALLALLALGLVLGVGLVAGGWSPTQLTRQAAPPTVAVVDSQAPSVTLGTPPAGALPTEDTVPRISLEDALARLDDPNIVFVDTRDTASFDQGHIVGAMSLPLDQAEAGQWSVVPSDKEIITYCA
jgi:hypothetical protein